MMYLSQNDIEIIGESVLQDYAQYIVSNIQIPVDIDSFARNYLGVQIQYRKLSDKGTILGLTTYKDVYLELPFAEGNIVLSLPENTILLEERLLKPQNRRRWRFTLAHECAHQILVRIEEKQTGNSFRKSFASGKIYPCRELKTAEDWCEWQANSLGAVLLMPRKELFELLKHESELFNIVKHGNYFDSQDYKKIKKLADIFCVSIKAMEIRIRELAPTTSKLQSEYADSLKVCNY